MRSRPLALVFLALAAVAAGQDAPPESEGGYRLSSPGWATWAGAVLAVGGAGSLAAGFYYESLAERLNDEALHGDFDAPQDRTNAFFWAEEKARRGDACRTAGWVLLGTGVVFASVDLLVGDRIESAWRRLFGGKKEPEPEVPEPSPRSPRRRTYLMPQPGGFAIVREF